MPRLAECDLGMRSRESLASSKVYITAEAEDCLGRLSPRDLGMFAGAVSYLEDDNYRNQWKVDLRLQGEEDDPTWAIYHDHLFISFKEYSDQIAIVYVNRTSMFRPPFRP
jgi:hypothetical protein